MQNVRASSLDPFMPHIQPRLTDKETGEEFAVFNTYWHNANWYIVFAIKTTRVGVYTFEVSGGAC